MYFYRSMPFEDLVDLYRTCDIALITPIRDGMNLVAKEYVACRVDRKGVLILSELAGAAQEMSEAILINPNNVDEIADAIRSAILMDADEQTERMATMRDRLRRYSLQKWASDFVNALEAAGKLQASQNAKIMNGEIRLALLEQYAEAQKRILFLDYDGTLVGFKKNPQHARPDEELYAILDALQDNPRNEVVIISGRDRTTLEKWFIGRDYSLIVEHGVWMKVPGDEWKLIDVMKNEWKETIRPVMEVFVDRTPGSFIEEKNFSLVWHYRKADPELGKVRSNEIKEDLTGLIANNNLEIMEGNKVIEVKNAGVNKGRAALKRLAQDSYDFILGIGDDWTDEYLFEELPKEAHTIRVGLEGTSAKFNVESYIKVRELLREFGESSSIS
jgi:trehalose 6-phosphate synthase/phosphatase